VSVVVTLPGPLRSLAGGASRVTLEASGASVGALLAALFARHPALRDRIVTERGEVRPHVNVFVGDESIRFSGGLDTPLADGAVVSILPAVSGG
jgi:MoaD family protein